MRGIVIGGGSIGRRHLFNLKSLGVEQLAIIEPDEQRRIAICEEANVKGFDNLDEGLDWNADFAVICSPNHLHIDHALKAARRNCHLFVEKPLSHTKQRVSELVKEVNSRGLVSLVGCNMRFHPGPAKIKELLRQQVIGKILFAQVHTGSYLPEWRTGRDYRKTYSASAAMGGGCILDCIHEIDLTRWYLGNVNKVFCIGEHLSSIEIEVEDVAVLVCKHKNGALSEIHLDYVQRTYERGCHIVGEKGSLFWDFNNAEVRWFNAEENSWKMFPQPENWQMNQMYIDEMSHFLNCLRSGKETTLPVSDAMEVMRLVFASKASAQTGCIKEIGEVKF